MDWIHWYYLEKRNRKESPKSAKVCIKCYLWTIALYHPASSSFCYLIKFCVQYEVSLTIWSLPLTNVKWHAYPWRIVTFKPIRLSANATTLIPSVTLTALWVVFMEHLQWAWHASRVCLPFRTPGSVPPFWDLLVLKLLRPDFSNLPCLYSTFHLEYSSVLSRICHLLNYQHWLTLANCKHDGISKLNMADVSYSHYTKQVTSSASTYAFLSSWIEISLWNFYINISS